MALHISVWAALWWFHSPPTVSSAVPAIAPSFLQNSHFSSAAAGTSLQANRPALHAALVRPDRLPLRTAGRYIVDVTNSRVKWACVNWEGASSKTFVVGGLHAQPLTSLARLISELGFNCVRLPYSTQGFWENPVVDQKMISANPELRGMRFREVFDAVITSLTSFGLMVIVNNHISVAGWCCNMMQNEGLWYVPRYNESMWITSLTEMARRHSNNPLVVAFDLRNELHDIPAGDQVTWGDGDPKRDWAAAATRAGNAVLTASPDVLIVVSAMCFCMDLRGLLDYQIHLVYPHRVVYEVHNYMEFQTAGLLTSVFDVSWALVAQFLAASSLTSLCVVLVLYRAWQRLGKPLPPRGVIRMTVGGWLALSNLVAAILYASMSKVQEFTGCNFYARRYFQPLFREHLSVSFCFAILASWGVLSVCRRRTERRKTTTRSLARDVHSIDANLVPAERTDTDRIIWQVDHDSRGLYEVAANTLPQHFPRTTRTWDKQACCGLQCCAASSILTVVFVVGSLAAAYGDSYAYLQWVYDWKWGFALQEGYPYTAPVWMGEFGVDTRGRYWMHLLKYLSNRDVDFAYWSLNGLKYSEGVFDAKGQWHEHPAPRWEDETYGLLNADYCTLRHPWKLLDLQAIMSSPAGWTADDYPCDRSVLGNACGG
eukprot:TRINITY_DN11773_c0_g2_i1.p1 TRINITY_DN11773_c0_g2~~TRINITY_DN11773_c0_g2_i1.p1  ORF type:complete len:656 (-),score=79.85 TRINITY_DN11773_c0_g2_i1:263-2230(-)